MASEIKTLKQAVDTLQDVETARHRGLGGRIVRQCTGATQGT